MRFSCRLAILLGILQPALTFVSVPGSFSRCPSCTQRPARTAAANRCLVPQAHRSPRARGLPALRGQEAPYVAKLDDEKVEKLWAWLCRAFVGDRRYNNLILAFGAVFGDDAEDAYLGEAIAEIKSRPGIAEAMDELVEAALLEMPSEETAVGGLYSLRERERGCLGAMGAGQWTGQWRTRPHALLDVRNLTCVEDWVKTLPRGARRTLAKADAQNFTVVALPITGMEPAPHSTLAHFRCVIEHEVRLLATSPDDFFEALQHGIGRYQNCITQGGEIREYRDEQGACACVCARSNKRQGDARAVVLLDGCRRKEICLVPLGQGDGEEVDRGPRGEPRGPGAQRFRLFQPAEGEVRLRFGCRLAQGGRLQRALSLLVWRG